MDARPRKRSLDRFAIFFGDLNCKIALVLEERSLHGKLEQSPPAGQNCCPAPSGSLLRARSFSTAQGYN